MVTLLLLCCTIIPVVSFQPSISISTVEWFERTTAAATPQQKHKQQVQRKLNTSTTEKTGNTSETQPKTPDKSSHKEKPESVVTTPSKKTSSPPVSPTDTQPPKKSSKTLPPKSLATDERTKVSHVNKGKSEKVRHSSQPVSPDKKSPTKTTPAAAMVTPEKGKTPTKATTPPAEQQQKTPQDNKTKTTPTSAVSTSASNTPVKPESQQAVSEGTRVVSESKGTADKSQQPSAASPDVDDDFVIVERPPPEDMTDTVAPVDVPVSEYFPVAHVMVNSTDWSLTVVNVGLCVMIYSFQPSRPVTAVKVCTYRKIGNLRGFKFCGLWSLDDFVGVYFHDVPIL